MLESAGVETSIARIEGHDVRVWRKGRGPVVGYLAGFGGLPKWTPFLDRLARTRTVVAPSLPGFPGGGSWHAKLDTHLDWILAARQIVLASGLIGADLVAGSVGAALAAELAALWPDDVRCLALVSPLGVSDRVQPTTDMWAQRADELPGLLCVDPDVYTRFTAKPENADAIEWTVEQTRASEAGARFLWPLSDTRLASRLHLIKAPTLLLRGAGDRVLPNGALQQFRNALRCKAEVRSIAGAGHLAELDCPDAIADAILGWCESGGRHA